MYLLAMAYSNGLPTSDGRFFPKNSLVFRRNARRAFESNSFTESLDASTS